MATRAFCRLPASDRSKRTADFRALFAPALVDRERAAGVVRWTLRGGAAVENESRRLAALEARCCDAVEFAVQRGGDLVVWQISGPPSAEAVLSAFYDLPALVTTEAGTDDLWTRLDAGACGPEPG